MDKVFKNGPNKICGRQPLKNLKGYGLQILLGPFENTWTHLFESLKTILNYESNDTNNTKNHSLIINGHKKLFLFSLLPMATVHQINLKKNEMLEKVSYIFFSSECSSSKHFPKFNNYLWISIWKFMKSNR